MFCHAADVYVCKGVVLNNGRVVMLGFGCIASGRWIVGCIVFVRHMCGTMECCSCA